MRLSHHFILMLSGVLCIALAAKSNIPLVYFVTSSIFCLIAGIIGARDLAKLQASDSSPSTVSGSSAQHFGLIWAWGALTLFITYSFFIPPWREWGIFSASFALLAGISFAFSAIMKIDSQKGVQDKTLLKLGRLLTWIQLVGSIAAMAGLSIDPQKFFFNIDKRDWAANNIFFFGAFGLAILSSAALFYSQKKQRNF